MTAVVQAQLDPSRYLARETLVSTAINGALSVAFFLLVFRGIDPVLVWGMGNYAFDFIPQSLAIGLMATLVPGLLCRRAIAQGRVAGRSPDPMAARGVTVRAIRNAVLALLVGAGSCALVLWATGAQALASTPALVLKVFYGAALGALVTRFTLRRMLV